MKQVIHIYSASGSGTTTLGRKISQTLGYRFMDSDDYYWLPSDPTFTKKRDIEERIRLMKADIAISDNIVISGSLVDWGDALIPYFTLAVRLVTDTEIRLNRLQKREFERFGPRIKPGGDMYEQHQEFIKWAAEYDTGSVDMRSKANHDKWQNLLTCKQLILNGADVLDYNLQIITTQLMNLRSL